MSTYPLLHSLCRYGLQEYRQYQPGLARTQELLERLGHPERAYDVVLIGGTNGKGTVAHALHLALARSRLKTGLFTSPHLQRFSERFCIHGQEIGDEVLERILQSWQELDILEKGGGPCVLETGRPTFFELCAVLALDLFGRQKISLALLEVGLGGRFDATNATDPLLSILVSLGHDHQEILGDSLEEIAREKTGIFRKKSPAIIGELSPSLKEYIKKEKAGFPLYFLDEQTKKLKFNFKQRFPLGHNLHLTLLALQFLAKYHHFSMEKALEALKDFPGLPGRREWIGNVLLDGAHNEEAICALMDYVAKKFPRRRFCFLLGMATSKNRKKVLEVILPLASKVIFTSFDNERSVSAQIWKQEFPGYHYFEDVREAFSFFKGQLGPGQKGIVAGSLFLVGQIREMLRGPL